MDDDPSFLDVVHEVLSSEGFEVDIAVRPIPAAAAGAFEVVITDLLFARAPVGLALVHELLESQPHPKIVVCSADQVLLRDHAAELRSPDVRALVKPFEIDDLLAAIRELTRS